MMPPEMRAFLPHAELDLAATIAAAQAKHATNHTTTHDAPTDRFCPDNPHAPEATLGVHDGVTCDKSGVCPIVGNRYHLVGHNYDLCEAEFNKLDEVQKALYRVIAPPTTTTGAPTTNDDNNQNENNTTTTP